MSDSIWKTQVSNSAAIAAAIRSGYETLGGLALLSYMLANTAQIDPHCSASCAVYGSTLSGYWFWFAHLGNWWPFIWAQIIIPSLRAAGTKNAVQKQLNGGPAAPSVAAIVAAKTNGGSSPTLPLKG